MPRVSAKPREPSTCTAYLVFTPTCLPSTTEILLPCLHAIVVNATERFRGILGYFTLEQTDRIEGIFEDIGKPVAWPSTIKSSWPNLLTAMEGV